MDQLTEIISLLKEIRDSLRVPTSMGFVMPSGLAGASALQAAAEQLNQNLGAASKKAEFVPAVPDAARQVTPQPAQEAKKFTRQQVGKFAVAVATKDSTKAKALIMPFQVLKTEAEALAAGQPIFPSIGNIAEVDYGSVVGVLSQNLTPEEIVEASK